MSDLATAFNMCQTGAVDIIMTRYHLTLIVRDQNLVRITVFCASALFLKPGKIITVLPEHLDGSCEAILGLDSGSNFDGKRFPAFVAELIVFEAGLTHFEENRKK